MNDRKLPLDETNKGKEMNKLGFGFLRLPQTKHNDIDWPLLEAMVDAFIASKGTYFDTAYTYLDGRSEYAIQRAVVKRYKRDAFQIADKLPSWMIRSRKDCQRYFEKQLERCGVDYFDVYLLHWLNKDNYAIAQKYDEFGFLECLKAQKKALKTGFSYHGDAATLEKILQEHPQIDIVQLQINYLDWDDPAMEAHKCYDIAARFNKEVVVMEPVKGGTLADLPGEAQSLLKKADPKMSMASWAIRFAQSLDHVSVVLSGMNSMEQMQDNMQDMPALLQEEYALLKQTAEIIAQNTAIPCTGCRYCIKGCPKNIPIPDYFRIYNGYCRFPNEGWKIQPVYASMAQKKAKATACIECKACERSCPQKISITRWLKQVAKTLE
jgi:hypothetical protein